MRTQFIATAVLLFFLFGCGGSKSNDPQPVPAPGTATLSAPGQNQVCITGTVVSTTESNVSFDWNTSDNTDSYDLVIKNLLNSTTTTKNTTKTQLIVALARNTPYSWWIISKSAKNTTTSQSDIWKFYNAGPGVITYAPFPAEIISPAPGHTISTNSGTVTLTWKGSSVNESTINSYDVYFGTATAPALFKAGINASNLDVPVKSGYTYYWKVVTNDVNGDTSDSGLVSFTVQ